MGASRVFFWFLFLPKGAALSTMGAAILDWCNLLSLAVLSWQGGGGSTAFTTMMMTMMMHHNSYKPLSIATRHVRLKNQVRPFVLQLLQHQTNVASSASKHPDATCTDNFPKPWTSHQNLCTVHRDRWASSATFQRETIVIQITATSADSITRRGR